MIAIPNQRNKSMSLNKNTNNNKIKSNNNDNSKNNTRKKPNEKRNTLHLGKSSINPKRLKKNHQSSIKISPNHSFLRKNIPKYKHKVPSHLLKPPIRTKSKIPNPCSCWDTLHLRSEVHVLIKRGFIHSPAIVSPYFATPSLHLITKHWSKECTSKSFPKNWKEEKFKSIYGTSTLRAVCICCGVNKISYVAGGNSCLAHIVPRHEGGPTDLAYLLVTCSGCNSRYSMNLLDWVGTNEALRTHQLMKIALALFKIEIPTASKRRKYKKLNGNKYLYRFLCNKYYPPKIEEYKKSLYV